MKKLLNPADRIKRNYLSLLLWTGAWCTGIPALITLALIIGTLTPFNRPYVLTPVLVVSSLMALVALAGLCGAYFRLTRPLWQLVLPEAKQSYAPWLAIFAFLPVGSSITPVLLAHQLARRSSDRKQRRWMIAAAWVSLAAPFGLLGANYALPITLILFACALLWLGANALTAWSALRQLQGNSVTAQPMPPGRCIFLWSCGGVEIALLLITASIWIWFAWSAPRTLATARQELVDIKFPITPEEMAARYPGPTGENAVQLQKLFDSWNALYQSADPNLWNKLYNLAPNGTTPLPEEAVALLPQLWQERAEIMRLLDELPSRPAVGFQRDWSRRASILLPELSVLRMLAHFELFRLDDAARRGDRTEMLALWNQISTLEALGRREPIIISNLVAYAVARIRLPSIEGYLNQLQFSDAELRQLEQNLMESEQGILPELSHAGEGEFIMMSSVFPLLEEKNSYALLEIDPLPVEIQWKSFPFQQFLQINQAQYYRDLLEFQRLIHQEYYLSRDEIEVWTQRTSRLQRLGSIASSLLLPALEKIYLAATEYIAALRTARTAIAAELYRRQHGAWPKEVKDLVPEYMSAVPLDPFDGQPLRIITGVLTGNRKVYQANDAKSDYLFSCDSERFQRPGFRVYSIGKDLRDNKGVPASPGTSRDAEYDIGFAFYDSI